MERVCDFVEVLDGIWVVRESVHAFIGHDSLVGSNLVAKKKREGEGKERKERQAKARPTFQHLAERHFDNVWGTVACCVCECTPLWCCGLAVGGRPWLGRRFSSQSSATNEQTHRLEALTIRDVDYKNGEQTVNVEAIPQS